MIFTQYYLDCLSQASYLIADEGTGQAIVVDPRRDVEDYLADAQERGLQIVEADQRHVLGHPQRLASARPPTPISRSVNLQTANASRWAR